jgi:hypothetical protein
MNASGLVEVSSPGSEAILAFDGAMLAKTEALFGHPLLRESLPAQDFPITKSDLSSAWRPSMKP